MAQSSSPLHLERLEDRLAPAVIASEVVPLLPPGGPALGPPPLLTPADVTNILQRAGARQSLLDSGTAGAPFLARFCPCSVCFA